MHQVHNMLAHGQLLIYAADTVPPSIRYLWLSLPKLIFNFAGTPFPDPFDSSHRVDERAQVEVEVQQGQQVEALAHPLVHLQHLFRHLLWFRPPGKKSYFGLAFS